jgi:putative N6-adenine-specific DNA methylase
LIEKALIDLNIAPGSFRNFVLEEFDWIDKNLVEKEKRRASTRRKNKSIKLYGYDIDEKMVNIARQNIENAGLEEYIFVQQ